MNGSKANFNNLGRPMKICLAKQDGEKPIPVKIRFVRDNRPGNSDFSNLAGSAEPTAVCDNPLNGCRLTATIRTG